MKTELLVRVVRKTPYPPPYPRLESMTVKKAYLFRYNIAQPSSVTSTLLKIRQL